MSRGISARTHVPSPPSPCRLHQSVALLAGGELDAAVDVEIAEADAALLVVDGDVVDACAAALDEAARLAVALGEAGAAQQVEGRHAAAEFAAAHLDSRQALGADAFLKGLARR